MELSTLKLVTNDELTDNNEIDVEAGGSIGTLTPESWKDFIAKEESTHEKNNRCTIEKTVIWNAFKSVVFFICLIFLIMQSVEFLGIYYQYRTNIVTEIHWATDIKLPAITFCFRSTISFQRFCLEEPNHCEEPSNMEELCKEHPYVCEGDNSTLKIPKHDLNTSEIMLNYFFNDSYNDEHLFRDYNYSSKVRTFVEDFDGISIYLKCYSENLHLYQSGSELNTQKLDFIDEEEGLITKYFLELKYLKPLYPLDAPQVYLAIHSPYVPLDPLVDLQPMRAKRGYAAYVQQEKEEHLLPPPYQTNCRYNGPSKEAKEFTNPSSHKMCTILCRFEYSKAMYGCTWGYTMLEFDDLCRPGHARPNISSEQEVELQYKRDICFQNCKQECLKLQYNYRIKEFNMDWRGRHDYSEIRISLKSPEVTVLRHVPLYSSGEIFSHIGGLLGYWLGISVFTFTTIMEKFYLKVVRLKEIFRMRKEERTTTSEIPLD